VVDRDNEFATANEMRTDLAGDVGTYDLLPATCDSAQNHRVLKAALAQQLAHRRANKHGPTGFDVLIRDVSQ